MGLKLQLNWFDKVTEDFVGEEYSQDFGDDDTIIEQCGLPLDDTMNNGFFNVTADSAAIIQLHLKHKIDLKRHIYQVSFDYRDTW